MRPEKLNKMLPFFVVGCWSFVTDRRARLETQWNDVVDRIVYFIEYMLTSFCGYSGYSVAALRM